MTPPLRALTKQIQLAGLVDDSGQLGNPMVELEEALAPQFVDLTGDETLLYTWPPDVPLSERITAYSDGTLDALHEWLMMTAPLRRPAKGMLDAFVRIGTEADVVPFARRFGVLGCCDHYLPSAHDNRSVVGFGDACDQMPFPFSLGTPLHWEPIDVWLRLASGARALLNLVARIYQDEEPASHHWESAITSVLEPIPPGLLSAMISPQMQKGTICFVVSQWLALGGASHGLGWGPSDDAPNLQLLIRDSGQPPTMAILASQLMLAVARASEFAVCSGCTLPYRRLGRRPQAGRRNYCKECQATRLPNRDRQRAHRARLRR